MPTPPNRLQLNPRAAFQANPSVASAHSDVMASPAFHAAAAQAMLAYQFSLAGSPANEAITVAFKLRGAKEFLDVLMGIGVAQKPREMPDDMSLQSPDRDERELYRSQPAHP